MRRLWVTAASGAILLLGAGCSSDPSAHPTLPATPGGSAESAVQASADVALANNTPAICHQIAEVNGEAQANLASDRKLLAEAATAKDPDLVAKTKAKAVQDVQNWSYALADIGKLVADANVHQTLNELSKTALSYQNRIDAATDTVFAGIRATVMKACPKA